VPALALVILLRSETGSPIPTHFSLDAVARSAHPRHQALAFEPFDVAAIEGVTGGRPESRLRSTGHPTVATIEVSLGCVSEAELVVRAREGDTEAFGELVTRHQTAVFRAALAALGSAADAEDFTQEAFISAYRRLSGFRGNASFKTWLLTMVTVEVKRRSCDS
jgi:Sigma-70 region 2